MAKKTGRRVRLQVDDVKVSFQLTSGEPDANDASRVPVDGWLVYTLTEERVLSLLLEHRALSREEIARHLDEAADGRLRSVLAALTAKKCIVVTGDGYQLNVADAGREKLQKWLANVAGMREPPGSSDAP